MLRLGIDVEQRRTVLSTIRVLVGHTYLATVRHSCLPDYWSWTLKWMVSRPVGAVQQIPTLWPPGWWSVRDWPFQWVSGATRATPVCLSAIPDRVSANEEGGRDTLIMTTCQMTVVFMYAATGACSANNACALTC